MTLDQARKILAACDEYIGERHQNADRVTLDGSFTMDELQAIIICDEHAKQQLKEAA